MGLFSPRYPDGAEPARKLTRRERVTAAANEASRIDREQLQRRHEDMAGIKTEAERRAWRKTFGTETN